MPPSALHEPVLAWFDAHARDLPWRAVGVSPWGVFVSEVMLQQTPVTRVEPVWIEWLERWPTPSALAAEPAGEAVRAWGRLGYPRRALRLHAAARTVRDRHGGTLPAAYDDLLALPGVGPYTASAVAAFAFGDRQAVVDTNVRRVQARAIAGLPAAAPTLSADELRRAWSLVPDDPPRAARWAGAVMELGAVVCTARSPRCDRCPVAPMCAWRAAGSPVPNAAGRHGQPWAGTDRMVRGRLLAVLREHMEPVAPAVLAGTWDDPAQRERCLAGLVGDGLVEALPDGRFALPRT